MWQEVQPSSLEKSSERETCLFMFSRNSWFSIRSPQKLIALAAIVKWTFKIYLQIISNWTPKGQVAHPFRQWRKRAKELAGGTEQSQNRHQIWVSCDVLLEFFSLWINLNLFGFQAIPVIVFPPLDFKAMCRCAMPAPADRAVEAIPDSSAKLTAFVMSFAPRQGVNGAKWRKMVKSSRCLDPHSDSNLMRALQPDLPKGSKGWYQE